MNETDKLNASYAERAVIGAALSQPEAVFKLAASLTPTHFVSPALRLIWEACLRLHEGGKALEILSVCAEMERQGNLAEIGGINMLRGLAEEAADHSQIDDHIAAIKEAALKRRIAAICAEAVTDLSQKAALSVADNTVEKLAGLAEEEKHDTSFLHIHDAVPLINSWIITGTRDRMFFGLRFLDSHIVVEPGSMTLIGTRPGVGKTTLLMWLLLRALQRDPFVHAALFSAEMSLYQIGRRLAIMASDDPNLTTTSFYQEAGRQAAKDALWEAGGYTPKLGLELYIDDAAAPTTDIIYSRIAKLRRILPNDAKIVVGIDYFQLLRRRGKYAGRVEELMGVSEDLLALAKSLDVYLLVNAQLNRSEGSEPSGRSIYFCDKIYHDAHTVLFLWNKEAQEPDQNAPSSRTLNIKVEKAREGRIGRGQVAADFSRMRFDNYQE